MHSTLTHAHYIIGGRFALMHMFYGMLFVLQALHVFWCVISCVFLEGGVYVVGAGGGARFRVFWGLYGLLGLAEVVGRGCFGGGRSGGCGWMVGIYVCLVKSSTALKDPGLSLTTTARPHDDDNEDRFYLIARMAVKMVMSGKVEKDVRSDDEDGGAAEDEALLLAAAAAAAADGNPQGNGHGGLGVGGGGGGKAAGLGVVGGKKAAAGESGGGNGDGRGGRGAHVKKAQ